MLGNFDVICTFLELVDNEGVYGMVLFLVERPAVLCVVGTLYADSALVKYLNVKFVGSFIFGNKSNLNVVTTLGLKLKVFRIGFR